LHENRIAESASLRKRRAGTILKNRSDNPDIICKHGTGWLGGQSGLVITPAAGTLENPQCSVNVAGVKVTKSGAELTVEVPVTFKAGIGGVLGTFLQAQDIRGTWTGMTQLGNRAAPGTSQRVAPLVSGVNVEFDRSSTRAGIVPLTANHAGCVAFLSMIHVRISSDIVGGGVPRCVPAGSEHDEPGQRCRRRDGIADVGTTRRRGYYPARRVC
jgi:hypothetical protein